MDSLPSRFRALAPAVEHASLRVVRQTVEAVSVRQNVPEPTTTSIDQGGMVTIVQGGGMGYAATCDLSDAGLKDAIARASEWAALSARGGVFGGQAPRLPAPSGRYGTPPANPLALTKAERIELLMSETRECKVSDRIVDYAANLTTTHAEQLLVLAGGGQVFQEFDFTVPGLHVSAYADGKSQTRSWGGRYNGFCQQGGYEVLERAGFRGAGRRTAESALELLAAPNCPTGELDVVLMPDQMMLQIHESIGHPLELDRILGDERNYAGTSFVTLDMFGTYRYGTDLLNVTYDPTRAEEFASFGYDDEGQKAERDHVIRNGLLVKPLGGTVSRARAGTDGVATSRASSWNRPPIDRMSNLNLEPGDQTLEDLIASTEDGVLMRTNVSWSIDDSRNKFQFGCEWGQRIRRGRLSEVVRNPNYRGVSATFWRSLVGVGDAASLEVMGTPFCGKGEPNQLVRVGHASPPCKFRKVSVFGGDR